MGDLNFPPNKPNDFYASKFFEILSTFNFSQHWDFPTHKLGNSLDLIFFNNINNLTTEQLHFSDHYFIYFILPFSQPFTKFSFSGSDHGLILMKLNFPNFFSLLVSLRPLLLMLMFL